MEKERSLELLARQRTRVSELVGKSSDNSEFRKWKRDTRVVIEKIFGEGSSHVAEFDAIRFVFLAMDSGYERQEFHKALSRADTLMLSIIDEINEFGFSETSKTALPPSALAAVENICFRFHSIARQLNARHDNRETLSITDEYDVQDLMHALLRLHFDDIREEEWTPSLAGASARQDFLLKREKIVIEVKKTRPTLKAKQLGEELLVDIARYRTHPDCDCLLCFVYDPDGRIGNPAGLERDLESQSDDKLKVRVIIRPNS